ncbi:MAG: hypothetical protein R6V47_03360 [Candidatus Delongbacteria bacterium]
MEKKIDHKVLTITNKKSHCEPEILVQRIKNFPLEWLDRIKRTENDLMISKSEIDRMCNDIAENRNNTFAGK